MIGSLGNVTFVSSESVLRTFRDFQRTRTARWHKHEMLGRKPKYEFLGPDSEQVTFSIRFDIGRGLNPTKELNALAEFCRSGRHAPLVIGQQFLGNFFLQDVAEAHKSYDNRGNLFLAEASITLVEYTR